MKGGGARGGKHISSAPPHMERGRERRHFFSVGFLGLYADMRQPPGVGTGRQSFTA